MADERMGVPDERPTAARLESDASAWDGFVAASSTPTHLQSTAWAEIKRPNGWSSIRVASDHGSGLVGTQMLMRRPRGMPWGLGYVPRGPVSSGVLDASAMRVATERLRGAARAARVATVLMEPEIEPGMGIEETLSDFGWRRAAHGQPEATRFIDLTRPEPELWSDLRSSARWSVNKSRRSGIRVVEGDASRIDDFFRLHADSMSRGGVVPRAVRTYRAMFDILAPRRMAHLLFAEVEATGEAVATVFLVSCGPRVVDMYAGMTLEGGRLRANYLLKWETLMRCQAWGYREYDFWGVPRAGIAEFKSAFGGREVRYVGAWELPVDRVGRVLLETGRRLRERYVRRRDPRARAPDGADRT